MVQLYTPNLAAVVQWVTGDHLLNTKSADFDSNSVAPSKCVLQNFSMLTCNTHISGNSFLLQAADVLQCDEKLSVDL